ncbi:MAG: 2-hydroxychromene-2-carboxylate isomerase [Pseudomonadota bacterium]
MLTFWYDFTSTYSYLAAMRMEDEAARSGVEVVWRPLILGPIFAEAGFKTSPNIIDPAKARYMWRDLARRAEGRGLPFRVPADFPMRSINAARAALAVSDAERPGLSRAIFERGFGEGRDINDPAVLAEAVAAAGHDPAAIMDRIGAPEVKEALRSAVSEARGQGVFGAPAFICPDGELFWGDDRLADALEWAASRAAG